ncbi:MAG: LpxI family protein [Candidatus Melainabacteria bacterium]
MLTESANGLKKPDTTSIRRIGLIAGEGHLPLHVARNAMAEGIEVVPFVVDKGVLATLARQTRHKGHLITPGLLAVNLGLLKAEQITHLVFAGKVNKWTLLKNPKLDQLAVDALRQTIRLNDDAIMLWLVSQLRNEGIEVLSQTRYLRNLFMSEQQLSGRAPTPEEWRDIDYGFDIAKEMGRLDIGQTIVVKDRMIIAVEAIEGTDVCLKRAGKLAANKGGVVVKVAKPDQDQRFDVPTVGLRTLKTMKQHGLKVLATEADQTLFLDAEEMVPYANRHGIAIVSTTHAAIQQALSASAGPVS